MNGIRGLLKLFRSHRTFFSAQMDTSERSCYNPILSWNPEVENYFIKAYGADHFARISKALTYPSCYSCVRVNTLKTTSDAVIKKLLGVLHETELENSVKTLNGSSQGGPLSKCQLPGLDHVVFVQGSGPHKIDYGYAENKPPKEVIVSRKCAEAVLRGAQVYVPGVLACSSHVEKGDVVAVSVALEQRLNGGWGIDITRGTVLQGLQTDIKYSERSSLYIGQGTTNMSRTEMFRVPHGVAVEMTNRVFKLPSFHGVLEGEIFLQNLPSIITAHALDPLPGERILDMCAAPGGKTTAIAVLMKDVGEVVAVDRSHNKVFDIQKLAVELGLACIITYKLDALKAVCQRNKSNDVNPLYSSEDSGIVAAQCSDLNKVNIRKEIFSMKEEPNVDATCNENGKNLSAIDAGSSKGLYDCKADIRRNTRRARNGPGRNQCVGGRVESSRGFSPDSFDRVLLDAPCSALGLRPRLFAGEETIESLRNHAKYQRRMFDQAVQLVRAGGFLVYSTCTINPGENEALVRYALDTYKFLSLASQHPRIGGPGIVGQHVFPDGHVEEWLRPGEEEFVQRFDPSSPLDTIGFFIAKFNVGPKDT